MTWPADTTANLESFYGRFQLKADGTPTAAWEATNLAAIKPPYPMVLSWDPTRSLTRIRCHRLVADSLQRVLAALALAFPSDQARRTSGIALYGGAYEFRRIAGSARLSVHAWGAAIDLDPDRNPMGVPWQPGQGLPQSVIDAFAAEGWRWGGTFPRPDPMHFQATS